MNNDSSHNYLFRYWLPLTLIAVVLTRLPFLWTGYGADADAWLTASSASTLWKTGTYFPSRLPGYPLHEIILAPFVPLGGAFLSNTLTLLVSIGALLAWFFIGQRYAHHNKLLVVALAFAPVVWQHSADTMDYMWSLCFILFSLLFAERRKVVFSGMLLGVAAGFRPSNLVIGLPLLIFLFLNKQRAKDLLLFSFSALLIASIAYLPLLAKYGLSGWIEATRVQMSDIHPRSIAERAIAFGYRTVYSIGPIAMALALLFLSRCRTSFFESLRSREPIVVFSVCTVIVYLVLFWLLPLERAYLLPAMPFLFLLVDRCTSTKQFALFTCCLILSGIVNFDIIDKEHRRDARVNVHAGMVIEELEIRHLVLNVRRATASLSFDHKAIVMTSDPTFWFDNELVTPADDPGFVNNDYEGHLQFEGHRKLVHKKDDPNTLFTMYLLRDELERARALGYSIYCVKRVQKYVENEAGYDLAAAGVAFIDLPL